MLRGSWAVVSRDHRHPPDAPPLWVIIGPEEASGRLQAEEATLPAAWRDARRARPARRPAHRRSGAATTTAQHDSEQRQSAQGHAVATAAGGRAEGALGRGLRAVALVGYGRDRVRLDVDIEGELTRELVGASSQIGRTDVLPVTEQRAALVFAGRIASLHGLGLAVLVVIGLTTEHAIAIHFFLALILD